jgi:hypothetical protein
MEPVSTSCSATEQFSFVEQKSRGNHVTILFSYALVYIDRKESENAF